MDGVNRQDQSEVKALSIAWETAVVLQADLVGFSRRAADLANQGPEGAESLSCVLEAFFSKIICIVETKGGLVAGFAGDAVVAIWPGAGADQIAAEAARLIHSEMPALLQCRISIATGGAGIDRFTHAGTDEIWLATGPAAELAAQLNAETAPGTTLIGQIARKRARDGNAEEARLVPRHDRTPLTRVWHQISGDTNAPAFRDLTVLSCDLSGGTASAELGPAEVAQRLGRIYHHIGPWGGLPVNMVSEDKGMVLHIVFGLPPLGPTGRELRAMRAANAITQDLNLGCPVGVADGRMFISQHGTETTRTVSAIGWPSSLATRLMQAAHDAPLVDVDTADRAGYEINMEALPPIRVKGWNHPVAIKCIRYATMVRDPSLTSPIAHWLNDPGQQHPIHNVTGPRGIGRSEHLRALCDVAQDSGWHVIRPALRPDGALLAYDGIARVAADVISTAEILPAFTSVEVALLRQMPPLRDVIPGQDSEWAPIPPSGEVQREILETALRRIINTPQDTAPLLIALDDVQLLDRSSAAMLERMAQDGLRVVTTTRTGSSAAVSHDDYEIAPLDVSGVARMICLLTGAPTCEPDTVQELYAKSGGNPLFLKELVRELTRTGRLTIAGGVLRLPTSEPADPQQRSISPLTLRELATSHLDLCNPTDRQVLSVASVLPEEFTASTLSALPDVPDLAWIDAALASLVAQDFLILSPQGKLRFRDDLIREASYDALPFAARRKLHQHLAEHCGPDELADAARHWAGAGQPDRAFDCHEQLAQNASTLFAQDEAIAHAAQARLIAQRNNLKLPAIRHAELLMTEGNAALEAVELRMAEERLKDALNILGRPQPRNMITQSLKVLPALGRQALHRIRGRATPRHIPNAALVATAHKNLAEIAYFEGRLGEVLLHTLESLNIAEQVGLTSEMVAGYSALSIGFETTGLSNIADTYAARARNTALAGNNPHDQAFASLVALVLLAGRGSWREADEAAAQARQLYAEIGSSGRLRQSIATQIHLRLARGLLRADDADLAQLEHGLDSRVSAQIRVWVRTARIGAALASGEGVPPVAYQALTGLVTHPQLNAADELFALCALSLADLLNGQPQLAAERARLALDLAEKSPPAAWHLGTGLRWLCCVTTLMQDEPAARRARKILRQFARKMPVAAAASAYHCAFNQSNVAKRTAMFAASAKIAERQQYVSDADVFSALSNTLSSSTQERAHEF